MRGEGIVPTIDLATGNNGGNGGFGNGFGDGAWWIIILFLFVFCGWGNNGFGNGSNGGNGADMNYVLSSDFSMLQRLISDGFNSVNSGINQVNQGICNLGYNTLENFNTTNMNIATNFANLNNALCNQSFQIERGITGLGSQLADCCCKTQSGMMEINYNNAQNTCAITNAINSGIRDVVDNQNANYRALHDEIVANRIEDKNAQITAQQNEINALRLAASQERQNNYLINELKPCPIPAYITCNPYQSYPITYSNSSCGCNCGNY